MDKPETKRKGKITFIMADGSVRDTLEGYEVPVNENTAIVYRMLAMATLKRMKREAENSP